MPELIKKSQSNIDAADFLIRNEFYTSSVHCFYYSCLQYIKHYLKHKAKISYDCQDEPKKDSHAVLLGMVRDNIKNPILSKKIREQMELLKNKRVLADYKQEFFGIEESLEIKQLAESVKSKVKQGFGA